MATKAKESKRRLWDAKGLDFLKANYGYLTNEEIAEKLGYSERHIRTLAHKHNVKKVAQREYTIYRGEEILMTGNREECMAFLGISNKLFVHYNTPYYKKLTAGENNRLQIVDIGLWPLEGFE